MSTDIVLEQSTAQSGAAGEIPELARLSQLQARIAALRIQAQVAQSREMSAAEVSCLPMASIFNAAIKVPEGLNADRDSIKRDERIMNLLRERGSLRVLGAVASPSLADAIAQLYQSHANCSQAIDYLLGEEILARQRGEALCGLRLLLTGSAGVGKTDFALTLAKILAVPAEVISLSSAQAAAYLAGSEQYWSNTQPGVVWKSLVQGTHANPIVILDEIDKTTDRWGDPLGALYQLLEPRTAAIFRDKSIPWAPIDASRVNYVATANHPDNLHPAIRSRFVEIEIASPSEAALRGLIQRLYVNLLSEFALADRFTHELPHPEVTKLLRCSVREAKRLLRAALAQALREEREEICIPVPAAQGALQQRIGFV